MTVHVIGGGIAGLAAAIFARRAGQDVTVYEAAPHLGGRVRSFHDPALDCEIDNGAHILLSGNRSARTIIETIGASDEWQILPLQLPVHNLRSGAVTHVKPGLSLIWQALRVAFSRCDTVAHRLGPDPAAIWRNLCLSVMNTPPEQADGRLFARVMRETVLRGPAACRPMVPRKSLNAALIAPAHTWLRNNGVSIQLGTRITKLTLSGQQIRMFHTRTGTVALGGQDQVILATPSYHWPNAPQGLLPDIPTVETSAITNIHYRCDSAAADDAQSVRMIGLTGSNADWLFVRAGLVTVMKSADHAPAEHRVETFWREARAVLNILPESIPSHRLITEKRATPLQSPAWSTQRPCTRTEVKNLFLAGDMTATDLPCTIEGAIRSARKAVDFAIGE